MYNCVHMLVHLYYTCVIFIFICIYLYMHVFVHIIIIYIYGSLHIYTENLYAHIIYARIYISTGMYPYVDALHFSVYTVSMYIYIYIYVVWFLLLYMVMKIRELANM